MAMDYEKRTKEVYAAFNAHDTHKFLSLHSDDVSVESVAEGSTVHGPKGLKIYIDAFFTGFRDIKMEMLSCISGGSHQCEEWLITGTHSGSFHGLPPTGKTISLRGILVREWKAGKTCRVSNYYDQASLMRQLGATFKSTESLEIGEGMGPFIYQQSPQDAMEWPDSM